MPFDIDHEKEYPEGPLADLSVVVYEKMCYYTGVALGYVFKGFFFTVGALAAYVIYVKLLMKYIIGG